MAMADIVNLSNDITVNSVCRSYYKDFKFIVSYRDFNHKIAGIIAEASNDYLISCVQNMSNEANHLQMKRNLWIVMEVNLWILMKNVV